MLEHTSDKSFFTSIVGRTVIFLARPKKTRQKKYRQPIVVDKKRYATKADAETAAKHWEGLLV